MTRTIREVKDLLVIVVLFGVLFAAGAVRRRRKQDRTEAARTTELVIDDQLVRRRLGDGREEFARWPLLRSVEVVCTPVRTADGAKVFVLLAEGPESGCLVPLGVGHDDDLVVQLARLPRFRLDRYSEAQEHRPPHRTTVWERGDLPRQDG